MKINAISNQPSVQLMNSSKAQTTAFKGLQLSEGVVNVFAKDIMEGAVSTERTKEIMPQLQGMKFNMLAQIKKWGEEKGENLRSRFGEFVEKFANECRKQGIDPENVELVLKKGEHARRGDYVTTYYQHKPGMMTYHWGDSEFGGHMFSLEYAKPISPVLSKIGISEYSIDGMDKIPYRGFFENDQLVFNHQLIFDQIAKEPLRAVTKKLSTAESLLKKKDSIEKGANKNFDRIAELIDTRLYWDYRDKTFKEISETAHFDYVKKQLLG